MQMDGEKLLATEADCFYRGTVFRFPAKYPFEDVVDFMLFINPESPSEFSLVCTTGAKAGYMEFNFPVEALFGNGSKAISKQWIIDNWIDYIYPDTAISEIMVAQNYTI